MSYDFSRLERQVERLGGRHVHQAMCVFEGSQERLALIIAAVPHHGAFGQQLFVRLIPLAEAFLAHAGRRADAQHGLLRVGDAEGAVLAAQSAAGLEGLEFLRLAIAIVALADVDEGGQGGIPRPFGLGNPSAQVRSGHRLRRFITGVPMVLVPRVENLPHVAGHVRADQRAAVEDGSDLLEPLRNADIVDDRRDRRKRAQHLVGGEPLFKRRVAFRVERLGVGHAAGHPQDDEAVGRRRDFFVLAAVVVIGSEDAGPTGGRRSEQGGTRRCQKLSSIWCHHGDSHSRCVTYTA